MENLYREIILDHAREPRNWGRLDPADIEYEEYNPLCGDRLRLTLRISEDERIEAIGWSGEGCAISQAAASMLGEEVLGKTLEEVKAWTPEDMLDLVGIPLTINRVKCALLSLKALMIGIYGQDIWQRLEAEAEEE